MNRYAVFGLFDEKTTAEVREFQRQFSALTGNRTVSFFPVHVTIKGRFFAQDVAVARAFDHLCSLISNCSMIELLGPVFQPPDLCWLQMKPSTLGFRHLRELHKVVNSVLRHLVIRDEVSPLHKDEWYYPHVTLGWGASEEHVQVLMRRRCAPITISTRISSIALVKYPDTWPVNDDLKVIDMRLARHA